MKKNTLAKWMFAGAAMVVAFACQTKPAPDASSSQDDSASSCPCNTGCSSLVAPAAAEDKTAMNAVEKADESSEEISTYVIEIEDAEEVASSTDKVEVPALVEAPIAAQEVPVVATTTTKTSTEAMTPAPVTKVETTTTTDGDDAVDPDSDKNSDVDAKTTTTTKTVTLAPDLAE